MDISFKNATWLNEPKNHQNQFDRVVLETEPNTDFWQRSYYGFRNNNAPALLLESDENFTFTVKVGCDYKEKYDQSGLIIYLDNDNWVKVSIEFENRQYSRLGSVVTNLGYSDWASTDVELPKSIWYRLSRRGPDFLIEASFDNEMFKQMRIFHLHKLGETTEKMGTSNPPLPAEVKVKFGIYACSPIESSFNAEFSEFRIEPCVWLSHSAE